MVERVQRANEETELELRAGRSGPQRLFGVTVFLQQCGP